MKIVKICTATLAIVVTAMTVSPSLAQDKPPAKVVFSLDFVPSGRHAPWYAAIAEGYFKNEGLDVTIIPGQGGAESIQAVASGTANLGFMAPSAVALARANGAKVRMLSVLYQKIPIAVFSLNPGANVTSPKQLENLTLGSGSGSFTPKILAGYMTQQGLDPNSLHVVNIAPSARASALMAKTVPSIEFFLMSRPGLERAAKDIHVELQTFFPADHGLDLYSNGVGASEDYLAANPDIVKRFMRAALKGWKFALDNPDKAVADEIKFIPTLKPDVVRADFEIVRNLVVTADTRQHGLGWFDPAKIKSNLDFVVKYIGIHGVAPAAADLYALGYLPDPPVKP